MVGIVVPGDAQWRNSQPCSEGLCRVDVVRQRAPGIEENDVDFRFAQTQQPVRIVERPKQRAGKGSSDERCVVVSKTRLYVGGNSRPELVKVVVDMLQALVAAL